MWREKVGSVCWEAVGECVVGEDVVVSKFWRSLLSRLSFFLEQINCHGFLNKKQDLTESGKRVADRSWKTHYTVLAGDKLLFYKDKRDAILVSTFIQ